MKSLFILIMGLIFSFSAFADFIDDQNQLFKNYNLCDSDLQDQVDAETAFKKMFAIIEKDEENFQTSIIEVMDYTRYSTRLKNTATGEQCSILLHDDCYSAYCE